MTHEEIVEKVAKAIHSKRQQKYPGGNWAQMGEGTRESARNQARVAIKITGEAILKNQIGNLHRISETHIKILTQGKET